MFCGLPSGDGVFEVIGDGCEVGRRRRVSGPVRRREREFGLLGAEAFEARENSAREFIDGHLVQKCGKDWWEDPKIVPKDVRRTVEINRKAEAENRTHPRARRVRSTTRPLGDLARIVEGEKGRTVFKKPLMFPRPTWFTELVTASEHARNIVAQMNPLQPADIRRLEMALEYWLKQTAGLSHHPSNSRPSVCRVSR